MPITNKGGSCMTIFKFLKGDSSRISLEKTPFHEGYAYFTPDDGCIYIDTIVNDEQKRIHVNPNNGGTGKSIYATLLASEWVLEKQVLTIPGVTKDTNGVIGLPQNTTKGQMEAAKNAGMYVCDQGNGYVTVAVIGEAPQIDIPVVAILMS